MRIISEEILSRRAKLLAEDAERFPAIHDGWRRLVIDAVNGRTVSLAALELDGDTLMEMAVIDERGVHVVFDSLESMTPIDTVMELFERACDAVRLGQSPEEVERTLGYAVISG